MNTNVSVSVGDCSNGRKSMKNEIISWSVASLLAVAGMLLVTGCQNQKLHGEAAVKTRSATGASAAILTTDCGAEMDDQWALAHLLLSPELDLRAVITTHASSIRLSSATSRGKAAEVVQKVAPARSTSIPVVAGSPEPLRDAMAPRDNAGVDLLLRLSRGFSQSRRLLVLTIGASTDVASAILKDPSISNRVTVVAMGFGDWPEGRDFFNVKNDPFAWQVILSSDVPLVIGSAAVGKRGLKLTRAEAATLMRSHGPTGEYLYSLFDHWLTREPKLAAQVVAPEAWAIWDEIVVAYALGFARGHEVPRPQLQSDLSFSHPDTTKRITWLDEVETEKLWRDFTRKIDSGALTPKSP
jgi:inosine-uridine nucleoside N-ribohydrolase